MAPTYPPVHQLTENKIEFKNKVKNKLGKYISTKKIILPHIFALNTNHLLLTLPPPPFISCLEVGVKLRLLACYYYLFFTNFLSTSNLPYIYY